MGDNQAGVAPDEEFNYAIGQLWGKAHGGQLGCYGIHSSDVFYGTQEGAEATLAYVKRQSPDKDWHIYRLVLHQQ